MQYCLCCVIFLVAFLDCCLCFGNTCCLVILLLLIVVCIHYLNVEFVDCCVMAFVAALAYSLLLCSCGQDSLSFWPFADLRRESLARFSKKHSSYWLLQNGAIFVEKLWLACNFLANSEIQVHDSSGKRPLFLVPCRFETTIMSAW